MIVAEAWPALTEYPIALLGVEAQFTEALEQVPLYDESTFKPEELAMAHYASQDILLAEMTPASRMNMSYRKLRSVRESAFGELGSSSISHLVYVCLDSGLIPYIPHSRPSAVDLSPLQAIALQGVFLGYEAKTIAQKMGDEDQYEAVKSRIVQIGKKLGANSREGMVGRAFVLGLCVPRLSASTEAAQNEHPES